MCGICGIAFTDTERRPEPGLLRTMCNTMVHRGPDDEGQIVSGPVGLGMRRLSIIDLNTGHQPVSNEDGSVWIVFNGEIYNFKELRRELASLGHVFRTQSDTEVIVHGYEAWGPDVCAKLNGIFAFAVWDDGKKRLVLGRDHVGVKPLYYCHDGEKLVFGSEIKAILACPGVGRTLDMHALDHYLTFEYIPAPESIFKEIRKLRPGHRLVWQEGRISIAPYWKLVPQEKNWTREGAARRLDELLRESIRMQLISDVPLGAFLSGGLDSSVLVSIMAGCMDRPVKTFSIGFKESSYNELRYARAVAQKYGTEHHEFTIEARALDLTEKLVRILDEPLGDFSIFPTYLVSKMARDFVTVALSGDGGDELFAGYDTYLAHRFDRRFYHRLPKVLKKGLIEPLACALPPSGSKKGPVNSFKRFIEGTRLPKSLLHARWMVFMTGKERGRLFSDGAAEAAGGQDPYDFILRHSAEAGVVDDITRMGYVDFNTYLVDDILVKVDRMSMAASLEARVPYLDPRVVEFVFTLPPELKLRGFDTKVLLKKTFWNALPPEVQNRGKQGFSIPIKNWIRGELKPMMLDLLDGTSLRNQGLFRPETVSALVDGHLKGRANNSHKLWALMVFQQWHRLYGKI